ncbi:hypothetical protein CCACVL1_13725 [Corchorus capsularis]|uniref:Uncharacterized protein n=1 Tax=Corchorus capsularis TaxID=210143 RepID=A0A1R3I9Y2_COCAP|nr:hypothetical protein CCACVL1_13725 [Corchorus capsularis]
MGSVDSRPAAFLGHVDSQLLRGRVVGSVDSRPAAFLDHVDSQLLRGGAVANAIVSGERHGEANSRFLGVLVPTGKEAEEIVESRTGLITRRLREDSLNPEIADLVSGIGPIILGAGQGQKETSDLGLDFNPIGPLASNETGYKRCKSNSTDDFGPDIYSATEPVFQFQAAAEEKTSSPLFVLGSGSNQEAKTTRKWRKLARGSVQKPDNKQATQSATKEGKKRALMEVS